MAWRDRLRRRAGAPGRTGAGANAAGSSARPDASDGSAGPGPSGGSAVPGDWDGGWRRAAPQPLTLSRAPLGVSDGLAFRAGLAAWQNPSFDGGMGHALLPTAPTGLVHGMARPAAPHATGSGGGPLLLRAVRAEGSGAEVDAPGPETRLPSAPRGPETPRAPKTPKTPKVPKAASKTPKTPKVPKAASKAPNAPKEPKAQEAPKTSESPKGPGTPESSEKPGPPKAPAVRPSASVVRPSPGGASGTAGFSERRSPDGRPPSRDLSTTTSPAVLSTPTPAVQRAVAPSDAARPPAAAPIPLVRRVAVVPVTPGARDTSVRGSATGAAGRAVTEKGAPREDGAEKGAVASGARVVPDGGRPEPSPRPVVRPRPVGPRLTVARRVPGDARRVPALRPAAPVAPRRDGAAAVADGPEAAGPLRASTTGAESPDRSAPVPAVQRAATRTVLGPPPAELPSSAVPSAGNAPAGPGLPFVQRQAEDTPRGATGVPAPSPDPVSPRRSGARARGGLGAPLSAMPPSAGPPAGSPAPGARPGRPAPGPAVQRAPVPPPPTGGRPAPSAPGPGAAGPHAPLLGTTDVQRRITDPPVSRGDGSTDRSSGGAPAVRTPGPAVPSVTPSPSAPPASRAPAGRDAVRPDRAPAGPVPVVVARAVPGPGAGAPGATSVGDRRRTPGPAGTTAPKATTAPPGTVRDSVAPAPGSGPRPAAPASGASSATRPATAASGEASRASTARARPSVPVARRTLALLPARPLTLSTRAPEGQASSAVPRPASGPPVVAARWSTAQDVPGGASDRPARMSPPGGGGAQAPVRRAASHPVQPTASSSAAPPRGTPAPGASGYSGASGSAVPSPSAPRYTAAPVRRDAPEAVAAPSVQRAATAYGAPHGDGGAGTGAPTAVRRVPVVKPVPPGGGTSAMATGSPARPLPVAPPQAPPVAGGPPAPASPAHAAAVPVVRPRAAAPGVRPEPGAAPRIQRAVPDTGKGPSGTPAVPVKEVPARGKQASAGTGGSTGRGTGRSADPAQDSGLDLDDLARRLLDPMARLLRTELRRGRERTGRPYDGRR
ncbi:hypothetical protein ACFQ67_26775 [Streptomyces sp. NPDC056488]|uniref:hypothetical protein n=1 Tax=unclassified Streptomyces TaxID=2593676 RepID=UPI0036920A38